MITQARRKAKKGDYRLSRVDLEGGSDRCLALLLPGRKQCHDKDRPPDTLQADACWLADTFPGRAWIAVELFRESGDMAWLRRLQRLGNETRLPLAAANDVHSYRTEVGSQPV